MMTTMMVCQEVTSIFVIDFFRFRPQRNFDLLSTVAGREVPQRVALSIT